MSFKVKSGNLACVTGARTTGKSMLKKKSSSDRQIPKGPIVRLKEALLVSEDKSVNFRIVLHVSEHPRKVSEFAHNCQIYRGGSCLCRAKVGPYPFATQKQQPAEPTVLDCQNI